MLQNGVVAHEQVPMNIVHEAEHRVVGEHNLHVVVVGVYDAVVEHDVVEVGVYDGVVEHDVVVGVCDAVVEHDEVVGEHNLHEVVVGDHDADE